MVQPVEMVGGVARAGAMTDTVGEEILLCGGRDTEGTIRDDCMSYNYSSNTWAEHSLLLAPREEASCTVVADKMFILGGIVDGEMSAAVEIWDDAQQQWSAGPEMPELRARFCAVPVDSRFLAVIGGEMDGELLNSMKTLDLETNEWRMQSQTLKVARKDHACVATRLDDEEGILVAGGVDADDNALASVEFFSIPKQVCQLFTVYMIWQLTLILRSGSLCLTSPWPGRSTGWPWSTGSRLWWAAWRPRSSWPAWSSSTAATTRTSPTSGSGGWSPR